MRVGVEMARVSLTEFRRNMAGYCDRITRDREPLVVTRSGGKGNVVMMSEAEFERWRETVHLLSSPKNAERLMASIGQAKVVRLRQRKLRVPESGHFPG